MGTDVVMSGAPSSTFSWRAHSLTRNPPAQNDHAPKRFFARNKKRPACRRDRASARPLSLATIGSKGGEQPQPDSCRRKRPTEHTEYTEKSSCEELENENSFTRLCLVNKVQSWSQMRIQARETMAAKVQWSFSKRVATRR